MLKQKITKEMKKPLLKPSDFKKLDKEFDPYIWQLVKDGCGYEFTLFLGYGQEKTVTARTPSGIWKKICKLLEKL